MEEGVLRYILRTVPVIRWYRGIQDVIQAETDELTALPRIGGNPDFSRRRPENDRMHCKQLIDRQFIAHADILAACTPAVSQYQCSRFRTDFSQRIQQLLHTAETMTGIALAKIRNILFPVSEKV